MEKEGLSGEELDAAWRRLVSIFVIQCLVNAYNSFSDDEKQKIKGDLDITKAEDNEKIFAKIADFMKQNPTKVKREEVVKVSVEKAYAELAEYIKREAKNG